MVKGTNHRSTMPPKGPSDNPTVIAIREAAMHVAPQLGRTVQPSANDNVGAQLEKAREMAQAARDIVAE